ncbi:MAG: Co2+/Mg2+ efflux protein ApaG [Polaribacter sp.]|nr:Co2+/Mg2+ efflux protein ApaG [Polaribacter sp.]
MTNQVTKGIKISVDTKYRGTSFRNSKLYHVFSYVINIENRSSETVKLTDRFWKIYDTLNTTEIVSGEGVVGQTPILKPNDTYTYSSGCFLESNMGAMKGFYTMINLDTFEQFKVIVPTFQLSTPLVSN